LTKTILSTIFFFFSVMIQLYIVADSGP